jgi:hypothetical protein
MRSHFDGMNRRFGGSVLSMGWMNSDLSRGISYWVSGEYIGFFHGFVHELASPDPPHDVQLLVRDLDVPLVELVFDRPPPVRVFALFDELIQLVI